MIDKSLARTVRTTRSTFSVTGAPRMELGWKQAVPFEVELTWNDGAMSPIVTVRGWVMRRDGTPRKVVTDRVDLFIGPTWLSTLFNKTPEPGVGQAAPA
jgi:hypothetical protein